METKYDKNGFEIIDANSVLYCYIVFFLVNIITIIRGSIHDSEDFWSAMVCIFSCIVYLFVATFAIFFVLLFAFTLLLPLFNSLINPSLKEMSVEINIAKTKISISIFNIVIAIILLALFYFSIHYLLGVSIFNVYKAFRLYGII